MILVTIETKESPAMVNIYTQESECEGTRNRYRTDNLREIQQPYTTEIYSLSETSNLSVSELPAGQTTFDQLEDVPV